MLNMKHNQILKAFKNKPFKIEEISYNEFFMKQVSLIYERNKRRDKFYKEHGYIKVYTNDGQPRFLNPDYHYDYIELLELSKSNSRIERLLKIYENNICN